jgi:GTP-dependent phosphoenolpyruvate carboxykinase
MNFEEAKKLLKNGEYLRRKSWNKRTLYIVFKSFERGEPKSYYIIQNVNIKDTSMNVTSMYVMTEKDKEANDWMIVENPT